MRIHGIPVTAGSKIIADPAYLVVGIHAPEEDTTYSLQFPNDNGADLVLACDTLIYAIERVKEMAGVR